LIALLDPDTPLVAVATALHVYEKVVSNIQEVRARNARVLAMATEDDEATRQHADDLFYVPEMLEVLSPLLAIVHVLCRSCPGLRCGSTPQPSEVE
jgi:glucosamine--fructose-6-phosphate aminotransferase (isomerizing)